MGYSGLYLCPINPEAPDFEVAVVAGREASRSRARMIAHGMAAHNVDWTNASNTLFVPIPEAEPTTEELQAKVEALEAAVARWEETNLVPEEAL